MVLKLDCASPGGFILTQVAGPIPRISDSLGKVGRILVPSNDNGTRVPRTCEYVTSVGKRDFVDVIELMI